MARGVKQHPGFEKMAHKGTQHPGFERVAQTETSGAGIHIKASHKGLLHEKLGVPQGQPIPAGKIKSAEHSSSPALRKEAQFADNAKKWGK